MAIRYAKFIGAAILGVVVLFLAVISGLRFFNSWRAERAAYRLEEELMRPYSEDFVGGKTAEETFGMFLEALKKEDVELAAKYFVIDKQEEWRKFLMEVKEKGEWQNMVRDIEKAEGKPGTTEDNQKYYVLDKDEVAITIVDLVKQPNGIWKIRFL